MIVFYRGLHCPICKGYANTLQDLQDEFKERGVNTVTVSMDSEERAMRTKEDWGIKAGYGFSRLFTLYLGIEGAEMNAGDFSGDENEEFGLGFAELGAQFNFRTGKPAAIPYAEIALTGQAAVFDPDEDSDITFAGGGITLGGGLKYFISKTFALDLGLLFTFGNFSEVERGDETIDIDQNTTSTRLNFGLSWFPFNK